MSVLVETRRVFGIGVAALMLISAAPAAGQEPAAGQGE